MPKKSFPVPTGEIGSSGLRINGGFLQEEFDRELRGPRGMEKYRAMHDNSAAVGAALHAIEIVLRQVGVEVVPFSQDRMDLEQAEFLDTCLHDMSFTLGEIVSEALSMLPYGFALHEIVYKQREGYSDDGSRSSRYSDGRVGWSKIALRGQETITRWDLDENGGIKGAWQQAPPSYREVFIPIQKAVLFRVSKPRNNPQGRSLLRSGYWSWYTSKRLTEIMLIGAERDLAGLPVVRVPAAIMKSNASAEEKAVYQAYKTAARDIRRGDQEGLVIPSDRPEGGQQYHYDIQLLASGGKREFNVPEMVLQFDRWILTVLLSDMLMMGHQAVGSYALAEGKTGLFETSLNGYLETFDSSMNQYAVPRLMRLNGWAVERHPRIRHKKIDHQTLAQLADYLQKLQSAGMPLFPDEELERHLRNRANLPPAPERQQPSEAPESQEKTTEEESENQGLPSGWTKRPKTVND